MSSWIYTFKISYKSIRLMYWMYWKLMSTDVVAFQLLTMNTTRKLTKYFYCVFAALLTGQLWLSRNTRKKLKENMMGLCSLKYRCYVIQKKKKNARVMEGIWNPPRQSPTHSGGQRLNYYKCLKKNAGRYLERIYNHQHMLK